MLPCFSVSDLHGKTVLYKKLMEEIIRQKPAAVFFGGDLLPGLSSEYDDFFCDFFFPSLRELKDKLGDEYPEMFVIMGNDDPRIHEKTLVENQSTGLYQYINQRKVSFRQFTVYGYAFIPPSPFRLKDWERYDVSRFVDPGCTAPFEGINTVDPGEDLEYTTIQQHLECLVNEDSLENSIFLFHSPPYQTKLDRAGLDGMMVDHVPLDVHVGSIAIKRFIENKQPLVTLHGHIHESSSITGAWKEQCGKTMMFNPAYDKNKLSLIVFDAENPMDNKRELL